MIISTVASRWRLLLLTVFVVSAVGSRATASAATPEHVKQSAVAPAVDLPPGTVCDFGFHQESSCADHADGERQGQPPGPLLGARRLAHARLAAPATPRRTRRFCGSAGS